MSFDPDNLPEVKLAPLPVYKDVTDEREIRFVREMARHGDLLAAAISAQISVQGQPMRIAAERLWLRPEIRAAVAAQKKAAAEMPSVEITKHSLTADAEIVKQKAMQQSDFGNALGAIKLQAGLHGLISTKLEVTRVVESPDELTTEELVAEIRARRKNEAIEGTMKDVTPKKGIGDG